MPDYTCQRCGGGFSLPQHVVDRYPGWTPRICQACRKGNGGGTEAAAREGGAPAARGAPARRAGSAGGTHGRRARSLIEENLTLAEVLEKYHEGPQSGVFTDGSATPNPGPGGWGAVYVIDGRVLDQRHGGDPATTNNRMELTALREGILLVPDGVPATVHTDSRLVVDTVTKWAAGWARNGWERKTGPVQNLDLVREVYALAKARPEIAIAWVPAHSGYRWNEYADSLSTAYLREEL